MKPYVPFPLVAYALAGLLAYPALGFASAGKKNQAVEHESVDIEHRTTNEQRNVEPEVVPAVPEVSEVPEETQALHQHVTKEHREVHRNLQDTDKESHHDD
jgi:hypothetical protein